MLLPRQRVGQNAKSIEKMYVSVGTSIARPHGRGVELLSTVFDIGNARLSRYVGHACPSAVPYRSMDLLRVWVRYIGTVSGGAFLGGDASPTVTS